MSRSSLKDEPVLVDPTDEEVEPSKKGKNSFCMPFTNLAFRKEIGGKTTWNGGAICFRFGLLGGGGNRGLLQIGCRIQADRPLIS